MNVFTFMPFVGKCNVMESIECVTQVQLERGTNLEHREMQPLEVDVEHSVFKCSLGEDTIQIRATITGTNTPHVRMNFHV
jgi:hypothetical protein